MYGPGPVPFNDGYTVASMDMSTEYEVILLTSERPKGAACGTMGPPKRFGTGQDRQGLNRLRTKSPIAKKSEAKSRGIPHLAKTSEIPRISCTQLWTGPRVRLSL